MSNCEEKNNDVIQSELYAKFFQGLANPTRYKIVESLLEGSKNVSELTESLGIQQSQISNQLTCLKWCGFVTARNEGRYIYYQISDDRIRSLIEIGRNIVQDNANNIISCTRM